MSYKDSDEELFGDQNYDLGELEEITKHATPRPPTAHEFRIFESAKSILKNSCGVFSTTLYSKIQIEAAERLVDDHFLVYLEDLFQNVDDIDPEGYVKLVPDEMDLIFCGCLAKYSITWNTYLKSVTLPDIWKDRLSANGINYLSTMTFYRKLLNISSHQSSSNMHVIDHDYGKSEKQFLSNTDDTFLIDESLNCMF